MALDAFDNAGDKGPLGNLYIGHFMEALGVSPDVFTNRERMRVKAKRLLLQAHPDKVKASTALMPIVEGIRDAIDRLVPLGILQTTSKNDYSLHLMMSTRELRHLSTFKDL